MHEINRYNPVTNELRSIKINHTKEEYQAWISSACGGNVISLGANLKIYLPNTDNNQRSFIMTGLFLKEYV